MTLHRAQPDVTVYVVELLRRLFSLSRGHGGLRGPHLSQLASTAYENRTAMSALRS